MHPVAVSVYGFSKRQRIRTKLGRDEVGELVFYEVTPQRLSYYVRLDDHPEVFGMQGHVLPELGVQVVRFHYREPSRPRADFDFYVDIVRVVERGNRWVVRDLYLDVIVCEGVCAEILDTTEYLAALHKGYLNADEAAYALNTAHALLNSLAKHSYSLGAWLAAQGVTLTWPKSKSTV